MDIHRGVTMITISIYTILVNKTHLILGWFLLKRQTDEKLNFDE